MVKATELDVLLAEIRARGVDAGGLDLVRGYPDNHFHGEAYGAVVVRAPELLHGKTSLVHHHGDGVLAGLPDPFTATRYHSLAIRRDTLPDCLEVTAWTDDGEIMGVRHKTLAVEGVQFHPESILTERGHDLLKNFLDEFKK